MKKVISVSVILAGLATTSFADGAALYKGCIACHGAHGEKKALGKSKVIAEMSKADIAAALKGYKNDTYGGTSKALMKAQASRLSEQDIQAVADYIGK